MKIKSVEIENFCGLKGTRTIEMPHIGALKANNGAGKTSLMNAIRYVASGIEPDGDIIYNGMNECSVTMTLPSGNTFKRGRQITKTGGKGIYKINDKTVKAADFNKAIEEEVGLSSESIENIMSADIFKKLDAKSFGNFILGYIPERISKEKVLSYIPNSTIGMMELIDVLLPDDGITQEIIEETNNCLMETRKELNASKRGLKAILDSYPEAEPAESKKELQILLDEYISYKHKQEMYLKEKEMYERAITAQNNAKTQIAKEKEELNSLVTVTKPDEEKYAQDMALLKEKRELISKCKASISASLKSNETLEISLKGLESDRCPFSSEVQCKTDKSSIISGIKETIEINNLSIESQKSVISTLESECNTIEAEIKTAETEQRAYEKKLSLMKSIKDKEAGLIELHEPKKPELIDNISDEIERVQNQLKIWDKLEEKKTTEESLKKLELQLADYDSLVKSFSPGGEVTKKVLEFYSSLLDEAIETKASSVRDGMKVHFEANKGLEVMVDVGHGFVKFDSLSKGEQTDVIYLVIDLINQLSGAGILLLDETSVLDDISYRKLLRTIMDHSDEYDHILLAGVNNYDVIDDAGIQAVAI